VRGNIAEPGGASLAQEDGITPGEIGFRTGIWDLAQGDGASSKSLGLPQGSRLQLGKRWSLAHVFSSGL
jgi:hypothetical protein